jgi:phosphatidylserine decarboxylase
MTQTSPYPDDPFPIIAREGWPIIATLALAGPAVAAGLHWFWGPAASVPAGLLCGVFALWAVWFFRDPPRRTPAALFVAPADGVVSFVGPSTPPAELGLTGPFSRVSIFMNIFNVHVNRCPADATIAAVHYRPGKFFNASLDKASEHNERCALRLTLPDGSSTACVLIAGLIARRIVCRAKQGDFFRAGQRFGLIRFGSRVDVYMPMGIHPLVALGQKTVAGETVLASRPASPLETR